jgi:hypothetical protein
VRDDVHTNTLEGFFSVLKLLLAPIQHVDEKHLDRYPLRRKSGRDRWTGWGSNPSSAGGADETEKGAGRAFKAVVKRRKGNK